MLLDHHEIGKSQKKNDWRIPLYAKEREKKAETRYSWPPKKKIGSEGNPQIKHGKKQHGVEEKRAMRRVQPGRGRVTGRKTRLPAAGKSKRKVTVAKEEKPKRIRGAVAEEMVRMETMGVLHAMTKKNDAEYRGNLFVLRKKNPRENRQRQGKGEHKQQ